MGLGSPQAFRALANFTQVVRQKMVMRLIQAVEGGPAMIAEAQKRWPPRAQRTFEPTSPAVDTSGTPFGRHGVR